MESDATTTPADTSAHSPSAVLLTTAAIYLPLFAVSWLLFEVLRRRNQQLFEPVNHFDFPADKRTKWFAWMPFVLSIPDNDIFEKCGLDAWVFLRFIRIGQKVALLCVVSSFALFPIYAWTPLALPVQGNAQETTALNGTVVLAEGVESFAELLVHVDWIDRITLSNVGPGDWRMIFTVLSAYAITFYVMHLLIAEYNLYRKRRHAFLAKKGAQQYTIVVSDLPFALRRPQTLMAYMDYLFPGTVYNVYIGVECERLDKLVDERTQLQYRLEAAESDLQDAEAKHKTALEDGKAKDEPVARPHHKVDYKFLGMCCGKEVDSIDYYHQEIQRLTQEIVSVRKSILDDQFDPIKESRPQYGTTGTMPKWTSLRNLEQKLALTLESSTSVASGEKQPLLKSSSVQGKDDGKPSSSPNVMRSCAFVSFRSLRSAQAAQQLLQTENPIKMRIQPAPHIDDVQWDNFGLPQGAKSTWVLISAISTLLIVLFWTIPTAFVTSLAKPENLRQMSSFAGHLLDTQPWLTQLLEQLTPLILSLMNSLSNVVFKMLATREGHLSLTEVDASLFSKLNNFQVFQMFFVSTVTGSILAQVAAVVEQPSRIVFFLGSSIASQSLFFITYIITQIAVNLPMMLLRVTPILMGTLHSIFAPTYAKKPVPQPWLFLTPLNYESELEAPFSLAQQYLIFLLVVVFAPIAPLVGYAGMLYFVSSELIYKRFFFFVNQPKWNTQNSMGAFWQPLFSFILGALLMAQITLIGLLSLKPAGYTVIVLSAGLPCCTFLFYWYSMTLFNFPRAADFLPLDQCCDVDDERTNETFTFLDGVYQQPAMAKAYSAASDAPSDAKAHIDSTGGSVASQPPVSLAAAGHESSLAALNAAGDSDAEAVKAKALQAATCRLLIGSLNMFTQKNLFFPARREMEVVAAFVLSSGGVARPDELSGFFQRRPEVLEEVLGVGAPSHSLKKIVRKVGAPHGLFWRDDDPQSRERGPVIAHVETAEQRECGAFDNEVQWVPRALVALERHVCVLPGRRMKSGAISDFYNAYPLESAFMKRRCRSIMDFVQHYDPEQRRIGWNSTGIFCVQQHPEDGEQDGDERLVGEDRSKAPFARLESVIRAEVCSSFAHTHQDLPEPQERDSFLGSKQMTRSSWSMCAQELSILPHQPNCATELRQATTSVRAATDTRSESNCGQIALSSSRIVTNVISKRPVLCSEIKGDVMRVLETVRQVNLILVQARATPMHHPLAFLFMVFERKEKARNMRKKTRRAIKPTAEDATSASGQDESTTQKHESQLVRVKPFVISNEKRSHEPSVAEPSCLSLLCDGEWTLQMTLSILVQLNMVLLQVRTTPTPHPLAFLYIAYERKRQNKRSKRAARRSQALLAKSLGGMRILIPKATLEILSCCCTTTVQQPNALARVSTSLNCTSLGGH